MNITVDKIEINSFGKLKNVVVTADSGINILSAPNESGKSTLAAFIKFAFYGFVGSRKQSLTDNERELFTPWDGETSEGSITFTVDGEKYILHRRCAPSGKESCEIINRLTGNPEFAGAVPGEAIFGVSEEIFARTLFFKQLTLPQSRDEILADRLRDIAISADEQVSTQKAIKRLSEAKNELKGKMGNGLIPKAQEERDALEERITESADIRREVARLRGEIGKREAIIENFQSKLALLTSERKNIEKYEAMLSLRRIYRLMNEEETARLEYEKASSGLKQQADGGVFSALSAKNAELVAEQRNKAVLKENLISAQHEIEEISAEMPIDASDADKAKRLIASSGKTSKFLFILAGVLAVAGLLIYFAANTPAGFLGIAAGIAAAAVGAVIMGKPAVYAKELGFADISELKNAIQALPACTQLLERAALRKEELRYEYDESCARCLRLQNDLDEEIGQYAEVSDISYSDRIERILSLSAVSGEKLAVWRAKSEELDNAARDIDVETLEVEAEGAEEPLRDRSVVDRDISFYTKQISQLVEQNRRDELECASFEGKIGDPAVLVGKRDLLDATLEDLTLKHKAYETAIRILNEASDHMKSEVAPRIGARADEYFSAATGGKYSDFTVDARMAMSFGEDFSRSVDYLSAGTRDSAYLSLRLALADMLFGGNGVPVFLDDAFVRMDDSRLRMMSGALNEAAKKHQIFIFTHGDREMTALEDAGIPYTRISIKTI